MAGTVTTGSLLQAWTATAYRGRGVFKPLEVSAATATPGESMVRSGAGRREAGIRHRGDYIRIYFASLATWRGTGPALRAAGRTNKTIDKMLHHKESISKRHHTSIEHTAVAHALKSPLRMPSPAPPRSLRIASAAGQPQMPRSPLRELRCTGAIERCRDPPADGRAAT